MIEDPCAELQEIAAVLEARAFLARLCDHRQTPRIPGYARGEARALLRRFPPPGDLRAALHGEASLLELARKRASLRVRPLSGRENPWYSKGSGAPGEAASETSGLSPDP